MEFENLLVSVGYSAPMLIVYLIATITGVVFLNKYKSPALFAMLGGMIAGLVSLGSMVVRQVMWAKAREDGDFDQVMMISNGIGICGALFEACGVGMIVFAVFAGRKQAVRDHDDEGLRERTSRRRD